MHRTTITNENEFEMELTTVPVYGWQNSGSILLYNIPNLIFITLFIYIAHWAAYLLAALLFVAVLVFYVFASASENHITINMLHIEFWQSNKYMPKGNREKLSLDDIYDYRFEKEHIIFRKQLENKQLHLLRVGPLDEKSAVLLLEKLNYLKQERETMM